MDLNQATPALYLSNEAGSNNIGEAGCNYISQADMRGLESIDISTVVKKNRIEQGGGYQLQVP